MKDLAILIKAAEEAGRAALIRIGAVMAEAMQHSAALGALEALQEFPLERLSRETGQSQEELIAELQSELMDYREFYRRKMEQAKNNA